MKKIVSISAFILGLSFILTACHNSNNSGLAKTHEYNLKRKCPSTLVMKSGETLVFRAPENPSTGFQWRTMQATKLFATEETYTAKAEIKSEDKQELNAEGERIFRFTALKAGYEIIDLASVRSANSSSETDNIWQCHVRIS